MKARTLTLLNKLDGSKKELELTKIDNEDRLKMYYLFIKNIAY